MKLETGCWMLDVGCWMLDAGCWMLDAGCWMLDAGCWMLDAGCWMLSNLFRVVCSAFVMLFIFMIPDLAEAADVRAHVDRTSVALGESLQLTVSVSGDGGNVDISPIHRGGKFKVLSRGTSTSVQIVNGRMNREVSYDYTLIPLREGNFSIPPLTVSSDGKTYRTQKIIIQVSKRAQSNADNRDVFVEARVSDRTPYEGQQLVYTFRLYNAVEIANDAKLQQPEFTGFTAKQIGDNKSYKSVVSGREYNINELSYLLVPLDAGKKIIDPAILECSIVRRSQRRNTLDFFFRRGDLQHRMFRTNPLTVDVKPLPAYNSEVKFSGLVGKFSISGELEAETLKKGDSTTLSVVIQGKGNIMDAEEPEISVPEEAFKVYKDNPEEEIQLSRSGYRGKKIFRIALVPIKEGNYSLGPIRFSYFDISKGRYETLSTRAFSLLVNPSEEKDEPEVFSAPSQNGQSLKKKVQFTGRDILPLKEELDALESRNSLSPISFIFFLMIPALLYPAARAVLMFTWKSDDPASVMAQRAEKALKDASTLEASGEEFLSCLYRALVSAIFSNAGTKGESLTYSEAEKILRSNGYSEGIAIQAAKLLEKIESAQYSGLGTDRAFRENILSETQQMVRQLGGRG